MQTFLPYPDLRASAQCLDPKRLGKQRVEAYQILRTLQGITQGWRNHPAVRMWRGYEAALGAYMNACIDAWVALGFRNSIPKARVSRYKLPPWFGDPAFHASHRANLLRKDPAFYSRYGWAEDPAAPYVWPVQETKTPSSSAP